MLKSIKGATPPQVIAVNATGASGRPLPALPSPLEQALARQDFPAIRTALKAGADPDKVTSARLKKAILGGGNAAECAQLLEVASRMKRMQLGTPDAPVAGKRLARPDGSAARFAGRFLPGGHAKIPAPAADTRIADALRDYDITEAQRLLLQSPTPNLIYLNRHRDQLQGMLALKDRTKLKDWHQKGLLQSAVRCIDHDPTKALLKQYSYASAKPGRDPRLNANGMFNIRGCEEMIECRHLAMYWLCDQPLDKKGKRDYSALVSQKKMQRALQNQRGDGFDRFRENCAETHLVENEAFGVFLASQFKKMNDPDGKASAKRILITSDNHAMACQLKIKTAVDGTLVYAVNFYDPNVTATHRRVRTEDLAILDAMSMESLINHSGASNDYFHRQSLSMAFVLPDTNPQAPLAMRTHVSGSTDDTGRRLSSKPQASQGDAGVSANYLYQLMENGFAGDLAAAFTAVGKIEDPQRQFEILSAVSSRNVPAFAVALSNGRTGIVESFARTALDSTVLTSDQKARLLAPAIPVAGMPPGLLLAMAGGHTKMVQRFMDLVLCSASLTNAQKCTILKAESEDGNAGLKDLLDEGRTETVTAYQKILLDSSLPAHMVAGLLQRG